MTCKLVKRKLSLYMDGELKAAEQELILAHLQSCPDCLLEFEKLKDTWNLLDILPEANSAPYLYTRIRSRLDAREILDHSGKWLSVLLPAASVVIIALGVFLGGRVTANGNTRASQNADEWFSALDNLGFVCGRDYDFFFTWEPAAAWATASAVGPPPTASWATRI